MSDTVHEYSKAGYAKGTNELYNAVRPRYPAELLTLLRQKLVLEPVNVVEIGAGTGLFTRALLEHPDWSGVRALKAIEPSEGMRETFAKYTTDARVELSNGTFDATGVESGWADVIVIAQAFHWCLDFDAAAAEFARVLKPGGVVALIWSSENDDVPWIAQYRERITRDRMEGMMSLRTGKWRQIFAAPAYTKHFAPAPEEESLPYMMHTTVEGMVNRGLSSSNISALEQGEKDAFVADLKEILKRGDGMVWTDGERGEFEYPNYCKLVVMRRV
ncbi:CUE domain-containing protein [Mycena kentingensis (nom. inval.)]|nr:CUE domain-containing protein [Mycena kentingensis (nom. inval.)]